MGGGQCLRVQLTMPAARSRAGGRAARIRHLAL